jgi:hypothetical protein
MLLAAPGPDSGSTVPASTNTWPKIPTLRKVSCGSCDGAKRAKSLETRVSYIERSEMSHLKHHSRRGGAQQVASKRVARQRASAVFALQAAVDRPPCT